MTYDCLSPLSVNKIMTTNGVFGVYTMQYPSRKPSLDHLFMFLALSSAPDHNTQKSKGPLKVHYSDAKWQCITKEVVRLRLVWPRLGGSAENNDRGINRSGLHGNRIMETFSKP